MHCTGQLARYCDNSQARPFRLSVGLQHPIRRLCNACRDAADRMGYMPAPVPEWLARGVGKDLTGPVAA